MFVNTGFQVIDAHIHIMDGLSVLSGYSGKSAATVNPTG